MFEHLLQYMTGCSCCRVCLVSGECERLSVTVTWTVLVFQVVDVWRPESCEMKFEYLTCQVHSPVYGAKMSDVSNW